MADACGWCRGPIPPGARRDSIYCSTSHRQAAWRANVHSAQLEATAHPMRLAYADPPYMGMAESHYGDQATFAGEVDHVELVSRLSTYDGWALSCSAASVPAIAAICVAAGVTPRLAIWHRRRAPNVTARILNSWEGLFYVPARDVVARGTLRVQDILLNVEGRPRPTHPDSVIGMKPPKFSVWMFELLAALPGDTLDDLFPGSGMVSRAWTGYSSGSRGATQPMDRVDEWNSAAYPELDELRRWHAGREYPKQHVEDCVGCPDAPRGDRGHDGCLVRSDYPANRGPLNGIDPGGGKRRPDPFSVVAGCIGCLISALVVLALLWWAIARLVDVLT